MTYDEAVETLRCIDMSSLEADALADVLAENERLREALSDACDVAVWMSGSPSYGPDGEAYDCWANEMRPKLFRAIDTLGKPLREETPLAGRDREQG